MRLHVEAADGHVTGNDGVGDGAPVADHEDEARARKQAREPLHRPQCERIFIIIITITIRLLYAVTSTQPKQISYIDASVADQRPLSGLISGVGGQEVNCRRRGSVGSCPRLDLRRRSFDERIFIAEERAWRGVVAREYGKDVGGKCAVYGIVGDAGRVEVGGLGVRALHGRVHTEHARDDARLCAAPHVRMGVERHPHQSGATHHCCRRRADRHRHTDRQAHTQTHGLGQLSLASLRGRLIEYQLRLG